MGYDTEFSGADLPSERGGKDFGLFLPMANGGWIISKNAPPLEGDYAYNRTVAITAEEMGLDFILSMAKWRGYGGEIQHWNRSLDSQMLMAALAEATSTIKVWATVHPLLQNPAVTAKMIATLDRISGGRAGLNIVNGSYRGEFAQMGAWRDEISAADRYDMCAEWISAVKRLWTEDSVTIDGRWTKFEDCESWPKPTKRPLLICAGTSPKGMDFSLDHVDAMFLTGRNNSHLGEVSRSLKARAAERGKKIRTYSMMTLVIDDTDAAAQAQADRYRAGLDEGALRGMMRAYGVLDAEMGKENAFVQSARSSFMTPTLIGTAKTVRDDLEALLIEGELDGVMLIFPDYVDGLRRFGADVLPHLRHVFAGGEAASAEAVHAA